MKKRKAVLVPYLATISLVVTGILLVVVMHDRHSPHQTMMTGMTETAEIDIAAKIPGRIQAINFQEGALVHKGDTLAILESSELDAKAGQARAALAIAKAKLTLANNGLRPQEKEAAEKLFFQAKAQADLMEKTWGRIQKLAFDSIISNQERDQVEAQFLSAKEAMAGAEARLSMAREGSRTEDVAAATALVMQAEQMYAEATAWRNEKFVLCPIDGEVAKRIMHQGEIVGAGAPILTIVDNNDSWVVVTVKENELSQYRMNGLFTARIPALGDTAVELTVCFIAPMGEFATWRPTNQKGGFDLKTFEVHLKPQGHICGLRAGMSANIAL